MDPKMEILQPTEGPMEVMDDERSTSPAPETVTIDSEGEMEEEIVEEPVITTTSRIVGPRNATRTTQTKKREPDVIDLTEDDEEMKSEDIGATSAEAEDQEMPQLIDIQPIPRLQVAEDQKKRGNDYFKVGNYYQALDMYSKAIASLPTEDASYYGNRSACYMMLKRYKEALGDIRKSLQLDPGYSKGYLRLIRTTLALGNVKECEMAFESAAKKGLEVGAEAERDRLKWLKQQMIEVEATKVKKDYRKLVFLTTKGLEVATADTGLKMIKADALVRLGRHAEAQEICTEVLQNDIRCPEALYIRAMCHYLDDNIDKSIQFVRQGLQFAPDNPSFQQLFKKLKNVKELRESGSKMFVAHRYQEAKKEYHSCLALVSGDDMNNLTIQSKLYFNLALIAQKLSNADESLEACTKAIELNSSYLKAFIHRARVYVQKEMYDEAVRDFEAALKLDPSLKDLRTEVHRAKLEAKRAKRKDYYKILQVDKKATEDEIRKAYKKRALLHHPDRHANAPEAVQKEQERLFKDLGEAYEVLSDSKKRFRYDQGVDLMEERGYDGGFDASSDFLNVFFSNSAGGMPGFRAGPTAGARGHHQFHHTFRH